MLRTRAELHNFACGLVLMAALCLLALIPVNFRSLVLLQQLPPVAADILSQNTFPFSDADKLSQDFLDPARNQAIRGNSRHSSPAKGPRSETQDDTSPAAGSTPYLTPAFALFFPFQVTFALLLPEVRPGPLPSLRGFIPYALPPPFYPC